MRKLRPFLLVAIAATISLCAQKSNTRTINSVSIIGHHSFSQRKLLEQIQLKPGSFLLFSRVEFDRRLLKLDAISLKNYYHSNGFLEVAVKDSFSVINDKVDIFFVISGYLITSIILKELIATGNFSFKNFYERRIRRILPALLCVMFVSFFFAWKYLLPISFIDFSKSILYSLGFSSNFYFHFSGLEYNSEDGLLKPFLHTWSLSVEEQYYIIFPIIFLITFKYLKKYLLYILIIGLFISLGLADWGSRNFPSFNFYALPTRGWELVAGSLLAYFEINQGKRSQNQILNQILPTLGLFLIIHSIIFFKLKAGLFFFC